MATREPLYNVTQELVAVASARQPADLILRGGAWVNVHSGEILPDTSVAICGSRIAYCGTDRPELVGPRTSVIDVGGAYLVPGLLDAHVHIESSMVTIRSFAASALRHGTTGVFIDPHEIANVLGLEGVRMMLEEARSTPMGVYVQIPSCVPSAPGMETSGACLGPDDVATALALEGVIGLGEVMNYPGVAAGDAKLHAEIAHTLRARRVVGGHYASADLGTGFHAYAAGGPSDCHEGTRAEDVLARVRQGMYAILRQGSAEKNVAVQVQGLIASGVDPRHVLLCTDDRHPDLLVARGHMDDVVRLAVQQGLSPMTAIRMATLNTAEHFGVSGDVGSVAPGRFADILVVSDLDRLVIDRVIAAGEPVSSQGWQPHDGRSYRIPDGARRTVHIERALSSEDFSVAAPIEEGRVRCRVIEIVEHQVLTRERCEQVEVRDRQLRPDPSTGPAWLAVVDRHSGQAGIGRGLVRGYGISRKYGLASTVAHDSHNLLVMGTDRDRMAEAANRVVAEGGGICLCGENVAPILVPLPIAGLMSEASMEEMAEEMLRVQAALDELGCQVQDALMSLSFLALPVIPALRLTDRGLVDVEAFRIVSLYVGDDNPTEEEG